MFSSALLVAATTLTALVSAQNYSTSGAFSVDASQIASVTRQAWCRAQTNSCPQLCGGQASPNTCDSNTLNYTCVCTNGAMPNISNYDQTIPSFVCAQWITNCVANHPNDLTGITACRSVTCGNANASSAVTSSSSSASGSRSASATASGTGAAAGGASASATASSTGGSAASSAGSAASSAGSSASAAATSARASSAAVAMNVATQYGTGILAAGLLGLFGLAL